MMPIMAHMTEIAQLLPVIAAVAGVAYCFWSPMLKNRRANTAKRRQRTAVQAQERAAKIMQRRRMNARYASEGLAGDSRAYSR